ncbi:unnamed protein product [Ixodes hexagonus]
MSNVVPKRERRRKVKPKLSFGSSSGPCSSLPSNMQANLPELFELLKLTRGVCKLSWEPSVRCSHEWLRLPFSLINTSISRTMTRHSSNQIKENGFYAGLHKAIIGSSSPPKETSLTPANGLRSKATGPKLAILTEADIADIVKKLREFLKDRGPTPEAELWAELGAETSDRVRSRFGSLRALLLRQSGFRQVDEDLDSFLYYEEEEEEDEEDVPLRSPLLPTPTKVGRMNGVGPKRLPAVPKALGPGAASLGSTRRVSSSSSYESAEDEPPQPPRGRDAQTQTTAARTSTLCRGSQAGPPTTAHSYAQTEGFDPAWVEVLERRLRKRNQETTELQERLALLEEEHRIELGQLHARIEKLQCSSRQQAESEQQQQRQLKEQHRAPAIEEEIHCLPIEPSDEPLVKNKAAEQPAERLHVPDFYEVQLKMERQGSWSSDVESMWSSSGGYPAKTKMEQKWDKIIQMVKQKQQSYTEEQIVEHLRQFRESQGGLSRMRFNAIVAGVLAIMKNSKPSELADCERHNE